MNQLPVYLYSNRFDVILDLDDNRGFHEIMYQRKLKIQKGFKDTIQIQFKNSDQRPVTLDNTLSFWFDMIDDKGRQLVLTKPLTILDDSRELTVSQNQSQTSNTLVFTSTTNVSVGQSVSGFGISPNTVVTAVNSNTVTLNYPTKYPITDASNVTFFTLSKRGVAELTFNPADTLNLVATSYKFLVKKDNNDGSFSPAYSNTYYGITGEIEVVEDGFPIGFPVQKVSREQLVTGAEYDREPADLGYMFFSGWLRPYPNAINTSTPQVASISLDNFAGTITVEGTLDNDPSPAGQANAQAFSITSYTASSRTRATIQLSWTTAVTAVRFKIVPAKDGYSSNYYPTGNPIGSNTNNFPNGFVDLIQYFS